MKANARILGLIGVVAAAVATLSVLTAGTSQSKTPTVAPLEKAIEGPTTTPTTVAPCLVKALQALGQGQYDLAVLCCFNQLNQHAGTAEAAVLLWQAVQKEQESVLKGIPGDFFGSLDTDARYKIRKPFDQAQKLLVGYKDRVSAILEAEGQQLTADQTGNAALVTLKRQLDAAEQELISQRYAVFKKFSDAFLDQGKRRYCSGRGEWEWHFAIWRSVHEWCDNDDLLMEAVENLEYASSVMDELRSSDRSTLAAWRDKVRGCLSSAKFDKAHQRAKITLGERD